MAKVRNSITQYNNISVLLHWLIGLGIIFMFILGWFMDSVPKDAPKSSTFDLFNMGIYVWELTKEVSPRSFYFNLHKSIGVTLFVLIIFRILWRFSHKPPALLDTMKSWEKKLATGAHHGLYFLMAATPLAGIIMSISRSTVFIGLVSSLLEASTIKLQESYFMNSMKFLASLFF